MQMEWKEGEVEPNVVVMAEKYVPAGRSRQSKVTRRRQLPLVKEAQVAVRQETTRKSIAAAPAFLSIDLERCGDCLKELNDHHLTTRRLIPATACG